jgi:ribosomal protein L29
VDTLTYVQSLSNEELEAMIAEVNARLAALRLSNDNSTEYADGRSLRQQ